MNENERQPEIIHLCLEIALINPEHFTGDALNQIENALLNQYVVTEKHEDVLAGFGTWTLNGKQAEISWLAVRPELQGQGIGGRIVNQIIGQALQMGATTLMVKTLADEDYEPYKKTRAFYESQGFRLEQVIDPYPGWEPGNPCAIYIKQINKSASE